MQTGRRVRIDGKTERFCKFGGPALTQFPKLYGSSVASTGIPKLVRERTEFQPTPLPLPLPWAETEIRRLCLHIPHLQHPDTDGFTDATPQCSGARPAGERARALRSQR
ncbi:hypothetical protein GA0115244_12314 [Streptomyces sp. DvalAA-19]|nr:hypothetical protein GA0115244_12314 [Streptomyces sp. DvalAA-19]